MKKKLFSMFLALCMVLTLLPEAALAWEDVAMTDAGPGTEGMDSSATPTTPYPGDPEEWDAVPMLLADGNTASLPTANGNFVYCNGTPVIIKEESGKTYLFSTDGSTKYLDGAALPTGANVYGGSNQASETGDTSITMESGTVSFIFGGDVFSNRAGSTYVTVNGGTVTGAVYGGSAGYESNTGYGRIEGDTHVTVNDGSVSFIYGGGSAVGSQVTGVCNVTTESAAQVGYLVGGGASGSVGSTVVDVNETAIMGPAFDGVNSVLMGGGQLVGSVTGDVTLSFSGTVNLLVGGSGNGAARDTDVTLEQGGTVSNVLYAAGITNTSVTRNTKLTLAGGICTYIYGGSEEGTVTGNTQIDVTARTNGYDFSLTNIRAGGNFSTSVVRGNTVVNLYSIAIGLVSGGGYSGTVKGSATINVKDIQFGNHSPQLLGLTGQTNNSDAGKVVDGKTVLNLINSPEDAAVDYLILSDRCWNFDEINLKDAKLQLNKTQDYISLEPNDLTLSADSVLSLLRGDVTVAGNFTGGGTLEITEGNTFAVSGSTTGVTAIQLLQAGAAPLGGSVKLIAGANALISNYTLTEPVEGYALVKKSDGLYAVKTDAVALELSLDKSAPCYGDPLTVTVQAEAGKGVTTSGNVTLTLSGGGQTVFTQTKAVDAQNKASFIIPGTTLPAQYTLGATLTQEGLAGSATRPLAIARRPLTLDMSEVPPFSRPYNKGVTDVSVTLEYLSKGVLTGYCNGDSGAQLSASQSFLYRVDSDTAGTSKQVTAKPDHFFVAGELVHRYIVVAPDLSITIAPKVVTEKEMFFATTAIRYYVGTRLADRPLVNGNTLLGSFAWQDGTLNPPVGTDSFNVVFTPFDNVNHDFSNLQGWDAATKTVIRPLSIMTVKKEKPTDMQTSKSYTTGTAQTVSIDLSAAVSLPNDAGAPSFAYRGGSATVGELTDISVSGNMLTFTIPAGAQASQTAAALPITISSVNYEDFILTVQVALTEKIPVDISGITISGWNAQHHIIYSGKAVTYEGTPTIVGGYKGPLDYEWYCGDVKQDAAPKDVDAYTLVVRVPESDLRYAGELLVDFQIAKANLTVRAEDKTIAVGGNAPTYTVAFNGLVAGEAATAAISCDYVKGDPVDGQVGTYLITPSNCVFTAGNADNYRIGYQRGTLTVESPAPSGGGSTGSGVTTYTITATAGEHGSISPSGKVSVSRNADQSFTVKPDEGYAIADVLVDGVSVGAVSSYTFEKVTKGHTISVSFEKKAAAPSFSDVDVDAWYCDAVAYVCEKGLFTGTSATTFSPELSMSRAMLWTVLARMDGQDVSGGATWYEKAQTWAAAQGVTDGASPEADMTREQLAVMLYRYAKAEKLDADLKNFSDADSISPWAADAMRWAVARGILTGKSGSLLDPQGTASRAEVAAVFSRYAQLVTVD